jgi:predicted amidohydrolase
MLYNSASCIGPDEGELVNQRKLAIPPGFELDYFSAGQGCNLFTCKGFKIATLICYDDEFAETVRHVAAQGADLVLVPTALGADWDWVAEKVIPTRAFENGIFFAYANGVETQGEMTFLGKSVIAGPSGTEPSRAGSDPEILHAALDLPLVAKAQSRLPYLADPGWLKLDCQ